MKTSIFFTSFFLLLIFSSANAQNDSIVKKNFDVAEKQMSYMIKVVGDSSLHPRSVNKDGALVLAPSNDWTSGFFPGCLWYLYEYTKDKKWEKAAKLYTKDEEREEYNAATHDMGFKMFSSYGNGYELTGNEGYKKILLQSARTLSTRFDPKVGCIRSWDTHKDGWQFPVIIDNMMNLELLFWATEVSGDSSFYRIAVSHANTTMKNDFRRDYSTWHVINYDSTTGKVISKETHQGYSNSSCWARGESWALYGYTMCYRYTKDPRYLEEAEHIAAYILNNKNLPKDMVPYWDYDDPSIPNTERDASAAAIMCSALYELSTYSDSSSEEYRTAADKILNSLSSNSYLAKPGQNHDFLLMHSVGNKPGNSEVNVPLIYADYYFLEANLRKMETEKTANINTRSGQ
jgi:unsaturated chondroitin disaccharide hydrolase